MTKFDIFDYFFITTIRMIRSLCAEKIRNGRDWEILPMDKGGSKDEK